MRRFFIVAVSTVIMGLAVATAVLAGDVLPEGGAPAPAPMGDVLPEGG